jgi:hypothetical protein
VNTFIIYFLMFIPPAPGAPVYTPEKFADPVTCQMRVAELHEKAPDLHFECRRIASPIDLSKPPTPVKPSSSPKFNSSGD